MEDPIPGSSGSSSSSLSNAERLRQRRRQKILANQDSRMGKILGTTPDTSHKAKVEDPPDKILSWSSRETESIEETLVDNGVTIHRAQHSSSDCSDHKRTVTSKSSDADLPESESTTSQQGPALGFHNIQPDGSTIHPKLTATTCRVLVALLGAFLSFFKAKFFLLTFFSWEVAVFAINGLPNDEAPSGTVVLLVALLGLKDVQLQRFKFCLKLGNAVMTDLSILIVASLISSVLFQNYMMMGSSSTTA